MFLFLNRSGGVELLAQGGKIRVENMLESRLSLISQQVMSSINQTFMSVIWLQLLSKKLTVHSSLKSQQGRKLYQIYLQKRIDLIILYEIFEIYLKIYLKCNDFHDEMMEKRTKVTVKQVFGVTVVWQLFKLSILINQCFFTFTFQMIPELRTILYGANPNRKFMD